MTIHEAMASCGLSRATLLHRSGIPESTLRDILNGKTELTNCKATTVSKLAKALHLSVENVLQLEPIAKERPDFDFNQIKTFAFIRDRLLNILYESSPTAFIRIITMDDTVEWLFEQHFDVAALWLIGLLDYLCDCQGLPRVARYDRYRKPAKCV